MMIRTGILSAAILPLALAMAGVMPSQAAENNPAMYNSKIVAQGTENATVQQSDQQIYNESRKAALDKMTPAQRMAVYLQTLPEAERAAKFKAYSESESKKRIQGEVSKYYQARGMKAPAETAATAQGGQQAAVTWESAWAALTNNGKSPQSMRNRWTQLSEAQRLVILKGLKDKWAGLSDPERQQMKTIIDTEKKNLAAKQ